MTQTSVEPDGYTSHVTRTRVWSCLKRHTLQHTTSETAMSETVMFTLKLTHVGVCHIVVCRSVLKCVSNS